MSVASLCIYGIVNVRLHMCVVLSACEADVVTLWSFRWLGVATTPTPVNSSYLHAITLIVLLPLPFSCAALYFLTLIVFFYCADGAEIKDTTTTTWPIKNCN